MNTRRLIYLIEEVWTLRIVLRFVRPFAAIRLYIRENIFLFDFAFFKANMAALRLAIGQV